MSKIAFMFPGQGAQTAGMGKDFYEHSEIARNIMDRSSGLLKLPLRKASENLGVSESALKNWMKAAKEHKGEVPTRGSGNYASEEAKEIARLQRELRDTKDALEVLKKAIGILGN